jgi:hypothetical protein
MPDYIERYNLREKEMMKTGLMRDFFIKKNKHSRKIIMIWEMIDELELVTIVWLNENKKLIDSDYFIEQVIKYNFLRYKVF